MEDAGMNVAEVTKPVDFEMYRTQDKIIDRQSKQRGTVFVGVLYLIFAIISGYMMIVVPGINFTTIFVTMTVMGGYYLYSRKEGTLRVSAAVFMITSAILALFVFIGGSILFPQILLFSWLPVAFSIIVLVGAYCTIKRVKSPVALVGAFFCIFLTFLMGILALVILILVQDEFYD